MYAKLLHIEKNHLEGISALYVILSQFFISIAQAIIKRAHQSTYSLLYHRGIMIVIGIFATSK